MWNRIKSPVMDNYVSGIASFCNGTINEWFRYTVKLYNKYTYIIFFFFFIFFMLAQDKLTIIVRSHSVASQVKVTLQ